MLVEIYITLMYKVDQFSGERGATKTQKDDMKVRKIIQYKKKHKRKLTPEPRQQKQM